MRKLNRAGVTMAFALSLLAAGCVTNIRAVNPQPTVAVGGDIGKISLDLQDVGDEYKPHFSVKVSEFRQTLENGFQNMAGDAVAQDAQDATLVLKIERTRVERNVMGGVGAFLSIKYKCSWYSGSGEKIVSLAGVAKPRNPLETGSRHVEDVVEVMYEQMVAGLEKERGVKTRQL